MTFAQRVSNLLVAAINFERRVDPYFRPALNRLFQRRLANVVQRLIVARRGDDRARLGVETPIDNEDEVTTAIVDAMSSFTHRVYDHALPAERAGNSKTYGVLRGEFVVSGDIPDRLRHGLFAEPARYPAWVRFAGPGPLAPADMKDNGLVSFGIKVMGVPGPKLLADEQWTQDFTGISVPTFPTPNVTENLKLQRHIGDGTPVLYFLNPADPHLLDGIMQALYAKTHTNPLYEQYWSCVSYRLGDAQAMHYSLRPRRAIRTPFPRHPSTDYLRDAMVATLAERDVEFDFLIQLQTDARRMPIEDDGIEWPESLSPFVRVARLLIPAQKFDSASQLAFAHNLSFNPWHALEAHRPLGNQNRARRTIYRDLSALRQRMNATPHIEPTGHERFDTGLA